jgi:hypothetical protein
MRRSNATSPPPARRSQARRAPAALAILSLVFPGCAVHSWRPVAEVGDLGASAVRVAGDRGTVELASTRLAYPYLIGRLITGDGPVHVDVPQGARVGILRCAGARDQGRVLWVAGRDPSRLVGCAVRIETAQGWVALRVRGTFGADGREWASGGVIQPFRDRLLEERLRAGRAARHVDVDRDHLVDPLEDVVAVAPVGPAVVGARAQREDVLGLRHLLGEPLQERVGHPESR